MDTDKILKLSQVAHRFGVRNETVNRWAKDGKLPFFRTIGGHKRFFASDVDLLYIHSQL